MAVLLIAWGRAPAQTAPATYLIEFTHKGGTPHSFDAPGTFLGPRAVERRVRQGIPLDSLDLPVDPAFVFALQQAGDLQVLGTSRWQNSATIRSTDTLALDTLDRLPFVRAIRCMHDGRPRPARDGAKYPAVMKNSVDAVDESTYGQGFRQLSMLNGHLLHRAGATGRGMVLGVLDSGFDGVDELPAFAALRDRQGIVLAADLVQADGDVYDDHWHGRSVLSVIAGDLPGRFLGVAPEVDVALVRTEDADNEFIVEEDHWVRGAELLDSLGCDVLNTSLGYTTFDDSTQDHSVDDLDGRTTRISIAAGVAARKGMVVVNSAGNSGESAWYRISPPADAEGILAVGAVGLERQSAPFSGHGPSADGRVKPDVCAVGWQATGLDVDGTSLARINGTSFSGPIVAGLACCLWQLHPERTAVEITDAIRQSASQALRPDIDLGYGIPDLWRAHLLLKGEDLTGLRHEAVLELFPMPFNDGFTAGLYTGEADRLVLELFDALGRLVWRLTEPVEPGTYRQLAIADPQLAGLPDGIYHLRADLGGPLLERSVVKVRP
ncbi:MAG: S8 family serine peptidase [Flavobacteriales bacterium]|nr:S8 family serine peptidase [Flavobacteriales bacterium]MBK7941840.1 S8 family serine peptidase [Flavobacteriales bacterium]MBK8947649.1 S8 family serine peptidase [Flavobacteriales bacterium]MBK9700383.1 S8 family serine peptidase [Flavobacteriales bacterium]